MVRINLINPRYLADQHLIAEYNEVLMLISHIKKFPIIYKEIEDYCLGKGHMNFFKNKVLYLKNRHELLKKEMKKRGFKTRKKISLKNLKKINKGNWKPCKKDFDIIKKRLISKIRKKPGFYRYYGDKKSINFFVDLIRKS